MTLLPVRRRAFSDGVVEIGLGVGFLVSGLVLIGSGRDLAADAGFAAVAGRFVLRLVVLVWLLVWLIPGLRRRLPLCSVPDEPQLAGFLPTAAGLAIGAPLVVATGVILAALTRSTNPIASATLLNMMAALLIAFIPFGLGFATQTLRYYVVTVFVAASGLYLPDLPWQIPAGLAIWLFAGILILLSGVGQFFLFWWRCSAAAPAGR